MSLKKYRAVLIDDEPHVIEGLKAMVPWEDYGFDRVVAFEQAELALEYVLQNPPDLLITDVRMPIMDGLELIRKIKLAHNELYILIMSGYRDFEYVKKAITYGANGYLVKPVFEEDVIPHLEEVKKRIQKKNEEIYYQRNCQIEEIKKYLNERSDKDALRITGKISNTLSRNYRIISSKQKQSFVAMWKGKTVSNTNTLIEGLEQILNLIEVDENEARQASEFVEGLPLELLELYSSSNGIIGWIPFDAARVKEYLDLHCFADQWKVIEAAEDLEMAKESYLYLVNFLERAHHYQIDSNPFDTKAEEERTDEFVEAILRLDNNRLKNLTAELMKAYDRENLSTMDTIVSMKRQLEKILSSMTRFIEEDEPLKIINGEIICFEKHTVEEMLLFFEKNTKFLVEHIEKGRNLNKDSFKNQVESFVELHYMEPITIKELAEAMHMHPSYLGQKLLSHLGESFTHYIHRVRIKKSIDLMQTDSLEHLQEIAYQVGYNHYAVFIKYFKQYMQMTPNDYLKHVKK